MALVKFIADENLKVPLFAVFFASALIVMSSGFKMWGFLEQMTRSYWNGRQKQKEFC
jgi:hypothetical protein